MAALARRWPCSLELATALVGLLLLALAMQQHQQGQRRASRPHVRSGDVECLRSSSAPLAADPAKLRAVVEAAAWRTTLGGVPRSALILTSCDVQCLKDLFDPFIAAVERNRDGDFSRHLVIVSIRPAAYELCTQLQHAGHAHHCILEDGCDPPFQTHGMGFLGPEYFLALLQKTRWTAALLSLNVSVMWTDMDMTYFGNPLKFLVEAVPDADLIIQSEEWRPNGAFRGDACRYLGPRKGCKMPWDWIAWWRRRRRRLLLEAGVSGAEQALQADSTLAPGGKAPLQGERILGTGAGTSSQRERVLGSGRGAQQQQQQHEQPPVEVCCDMEVNGGLWLFNPTDRGKALSQAWAHLYFEEGVVKGKFWDASANLDQTKLNSMLLRPHLYRTAPLYVWDAAAAKYVRSGSVARMRDEAIYRISAQRSQSLCSKGPCGWMRPDVPYRHYWLNASGARLEEQGAATDRLVCVMPEKSAWRMISFHQNCVAGNSIKRGNMLAFQNWTWDEATYLEEAAANRRRLVYPDW